MKNALFYILLPVALVMNFLIVPVQARALDKDIRVGILTNTAKVVISAGSDFKFLNGQTGQTLANFSAGEQAIVAMQGKDIIINNKKVVALNINIVQSKNADSDFLVVNNKKYRGNMDIHITNKQTGLTVVNELPVEQYLYGVIAKEISPEWHLEVVKAQAVAARTYALYNHNKHKADDYDVCATNDCQVYGGKELETPRVIKATNDTAGQVLMYRGKIIPAYFHSSAGGFTENSENVWGAYQPYARGVVDYDQNSPNYKWEKKITSTELERIITRAGYNIGNIKVVELTPLTSAPLNIKERGVSGRVKVIRFIGTTGTAELSGEKVRTLLALKSTLFDISILFPMQKNIELEITDSTGTVGHKEVEVNLSPLKEQGFITDKQDLHRLSGRPDEIILISGYGFGHGIGLSQWGAKSMAEQGPQGDTTYYKEILKHYYKGVTIQKAI